MTTSALQRSAGPQAGEQLPVRLDALSPVRDADSADKAEI